MSMLRASGIHKYYDQLHVLKGVNISVDKGEIVSIVGSSGSGKSTLLHILGTLDKADGGDLVLNDNRIKFPQKENVQPVNWLKRILNYWLDRLFIVFIYFFVFKFVVDIPTTDKLVSFIEAIFLLLIPFLYYSLFEGFLGKTPAKFITQTKVAKVDTCVKPSFRDCCLRTLSRFIPFEIFSFIAKNPRGWHDSLSKTVVIDEKIPYQKKEIGNSFSEKQLAIFRNQNIGFVFQFHHLLPEFTALENVCIPGWIAGRRKKEVEAEAAKLLQLLGLAERLDNKPNALSGGEQQRVAVARALINKPAIVFADEPTGNLDSKNAKELHDLFVQLRNQFKQTFLIVTHNEEMAAMSDRTLHMKDGLIVQ